MMTSNLLFTILLILCTLSSIQFVIAQDGDQPYAIGFYFSDPSLPNGTCAFELEMVTRLVYPIYSDEVVEDSTLTIEDEDKLDKLAKLKNDRTLTQLRGNIQNQNNKNNNNRRLQSWCYGLCDDAPRNWLILNGCSSECRLRRRLQEDEDIAENNIEEEKDDRSLQQIYLVEEEKEEEEEYKGNSLKILNGKGDKSAKEFYKKVKDTISSKNVCRKILLNMEYKIIPLIVNLP